MKTEHRAIYLHSGNVSIFRVFRASLEIKTNKVNILIISIWLVTSLTSGLKQFQIIPIVMIRCLTANVPWSLGLVPTRWFPRRFGRPILLISFYDYTNFMIFVVNHKVEAVNGAYSFLPVGRLFRLHCMEPRSLFLLMFTSSHVSRWHSRSPCLSLLTWGVI